MTRTWRIVAMAGLAVVVVPAAVLLSKSPSHQRQWKPEHAALPQARVEGERATIRNVRNHTYNADGSVKDTRYEVRSYDLSTLTSLWYGISHFYGIGLAHTFVSFGFEDGAYLTISVEARQEVGEDYDPLVGLLRNYELVYVAADERDVIGLRTHVRGERVLAYRVRVVPEKARNLLLAMLETINDIHEKPRFYNTLTDNCTTNLLRYSEKISALAMVFDYRTLLPGYSDSLAYDLGIIANDLPLAEVRARARLDRAATAIDDPDFSRKIRGL